MNLATHDARRRRERIGVAALAAYAVALAFLLGPMIHGALGTDGQPVPDLAGPPADTAGVTKPTTGAPPAPAALAAPDGEATAEAVEAVPLPELTSVDEARAAALMQANKRFRAIVGETPYTIVRAGPWTTSNGPWTVEKAPELLGASFVVSFPNAIEIADKVVPGALYDVTETRSPPYQEVDLRVDAKGVANLMVLVDLRRGKVVNISPGLGSGALQMSPPPGFEREVPNLSNEYPDPAERLELHGGGER